MNFNFLNRIKETLSNLWGNATGMVNGDADPLKVTKKTLSPVPEGYSKQAPEPTPTPIQQAPEIQPAMEFAQGQMPPSSPQTPEEYYPLLGNDEFVKSTVEADKLRQGLGTLLLLQAFFESTLGRGGENPFGVLPPGGKTFENPNEAVDYQLGPGVMGGGATPNMNLLNEQGPLTEPGVRQFYDSYNPGSSYLEQLLSVLFPQENSQGL